MVNRDEVLEFMENDAYRPMTVGELVSEFEIEGSDDFREFVKLLNVMEEAGEVVRTRADRYGVPERMNLVVGRINMKARGYGFVVPETAGEADVYIPSSEINGALSGDKVMVRVEKAMNGPRREGKVIRVLERAANRVVGKFTLHRDYGFVTPTDKRFPQDLFIAPEDVHDARDGYVVVAEITQFPTPSRGPHGSIVEVLGHPDAPGIDILSVVKKYQLPEVFPEAVLDAAEAIPLTTSEADFEGRRDLRGELIVTIDGEDAKDLDDAVHVKELDNGHYLLGVHIADVGYYVKEGGALDKEALERGTSVYLVDRVIPMLPQRLSNNVCSLNPHIDRLTMTCEMEIDTNGEVVNHEVFPSVIKTTERMTYTNVRKILQQEDAEVTTRYETLIPFFQRMEKLALILRDKRMRRGAIDFDFDEVKIVVDEIGQPVDIVPRQRSIAERIIEEFMLAANETVAEHFHWMNVPFVYRIHEEPDLTRMQEFNEFIHNFGIHLKGIGNKVHPRSLQEILSKVEGTRESRMISTLMLRSMRQAKYAPDCVGHFGLAADFYTHFTSPIRRYPDLMIHRIMREVLTGGDLKEARETKLRELVVDAAQHSSERERVAQDAERECDQLKMVEYMQSHLGEPYNGLISGVTQFGLFVSLENGVEGLIHVSYLDDDYYALNEKQMALVGERTRRVFRMGDPVRVEAVKASKEDLTIDFRLLEHLREGTLVFGPTGSTVLYDEDLSPRERKHRIGEREAQSRDMKKGRRDREGGSEYSGGRRERERSGFGGRGERDGERSSGRGERGRGGNGGNYGGGDRGGRPGRSSSTWPEGTRGGYGSQPGGFSRDGESLGEVGSSGGRYGSRRGGGGSGGGRGRPGFEPGSREGTDMASGGGGPKRRRGASGRRSGGGSSSGGSSSGGSGSGGTGTSASPSAFVKGGVSAGRRTKRKGR